MDGAGARYDGGRYRVGAGRRREGYMGVMESRRQRMVCVCVVCESIACSVRYIVDVFFCISSNLISSSPPLLLSSSPHSLISQPEIVQYWDSEKMASRPGWNADWAIVDGPGYDFLSV